MVERVVVARDQLIITLAQPSSAGDMGAIPEIRCPWQANIHDSKAKVVSNGDIAAHNESLIQSVICSQAWIKSLREEAYDSIEMLAEANGLHPKVVRQSLRFAFLSPDVTSAILEGPTAGGTFAGTNPEATTVALERASAPALLILKHFASRVSKPPSLCENGQTIPARQLYFTPSYYPTLREERLLGAKGPGDDRRSHGATPAPFV
jgi:hypothetical protein